MRRFLTRILVCVVPVLISALVVGWATWKYVNGEGGFRLGVDLVGGTILVYEVDESKMPQDFKADELAASLKKRIDPADLYNITIRPVPTNPPRVEIILPTGGQFQAVAEEETWKKLLDLAAHSDNYNLTDEQRAELGKLPVNDLIGLTEALEKHGSREDAVEFIEKNARSARGRRALTTDKVEEIKGLVSRQGRLEFRILANEQDDGPAFRAARDYIQQTLPDGKIVINPANQATLVRLERLGQAPPPPRNPDDGTPFFPVPGIPGEPPHSYSWVMVGKSELYSLGLNNDALINNNDLWARLFTVPDQRDRGIPDAWVLRSPILPPAGRWASSGLLIYARKITDWTARSQRDREQGQRFEYFLLVRDPLAGQEITGDFLTSASQGNDSRGKICINFSFNAEGGARFWEVTTRNKPRTEGTTPFRRHLAIIFDSQVVSAPTLNEPIRNNGQITGDFSAAEVQDMVRILRAGALPATLKKEPASQSSMGSTLGADTIRKGTLSVAFAFLAVMAFMVLYYRFAGFVACVALLANLLLTVAFMVLVDAAFTLPGLAGLVLMLGMAVDANVLIYERLREEQAKGANLAMALRNGYDRAFPTIIDTHLSSIFTAIVLYVVGNDQLKGFGISLTVGLIISLFTSLYMTRTIFEIWLAKGWFTRVNFGKLKFGKLDLHHANFNFMGIRYYMFAITGVLTILGAGLFVYRLDKHGEHDSGILSIDFIGGTAYTGQLREPLTLEELRERLEGEQAEGPRLPDVSIIQEYLRDDARLAGKSSLFTLRTSEKDANKVLAYVQQRMKGDLKQVLMKFEINPKQPNQEATLTFTNQEGEKAHTSPEQVRRLLAKALGQAPFQLAKPAAARDPNGLYAELVLSMNEPLVAKDGKKGNPLEAALAEVRKEFNNSPQPERLENFDKQLASSTQERATYAILASWIAILLYLWFRFGNWTFGAAAVVCLIHDLFFTLGFVAASHYLHGTWLGFALGIQDFKLDLNAIAALLTLVGYSVNDTIVVFDRIREVRGKNPILTAKMINDSVNQTLSRTLLASTTVFVVVVVLYIFGGEGVKLFGFIMIVGVMVGTYSSIYVASPLLLVFGEGAAAEAEAARVEPAGTTG